MQNVCLDWVALVVEKPLTGTDFLFPLQLCDGRSEFCSIQQTSVLPASVLCFGLLGIDRGQQRWEGTDYMVKYFKLLKMFISLPEWEVTWLLKLLILNNQVQWLFKFVITKTHTNYFIQKWLHFSICFQRASSDYIETSVCSSLYQKIMQCWTHWVKFS